MKELTIQQNEIYLMLRSHIARHGFPPTRAEICIHFGFISPTTAAVHLEALERRGYIELTPVTPRGIRLVEPSDDKGLPVIGSVAVDQPILSEAGIARRIDIDPKFFAPHADYLFPVVGNSMRGAGILDGDLLAVHVTEHVNNGQIVVARFNDEVTVRSYHQRGNIITLLSVSTVFDGLAVTVVDGHFDRGCAPNP